MVLGRRMQDWLRCAVCYWHSFNWPGADIFGAGTLPRPWLGPTVTQDMAQQKLDAAFDFLSRLGVPYFTFHDVDAMAGAATLREHEASLQRIEAAIAEKMAHSGVKLLWGTANLFSHPRYAAGAATNPDPQVFAWAAAQVRCCLEATHRLGGENYVLWGAAPSKRHRPTRQRLGLRWPFTAFHGSRNMHAHSIQHGTRSSISNCLWPGLGK